MSLQYHLRVGTPLIWVNSEEPERVLDAVCNEPRRKVYKLDPFDGLVVNMDGKWRKCIVKKEDGTEGPTSDFNMSFIHVFENKGTFFIPNAHLMAKDFLAVFAGLQDRYRQSYQVNNADNLPMQVVLVSATGEIPPEIARQVAVVDFEMPSPEELAHITAEVVASSSIELLGSEPREIAKVVSAGVGLSESEFMQSLLMSVRHTNKIDADYINNFKRDKIKAGGVLEIRRPKVSLDSIGGLDNAKEMIRNVVWMWENPEAVEEFNLIPIHRILLVGVPGSGKSFLCEAVASELGFELAKFGVSSMMTKWIGESERNMRMAFRQVRSMAPIVCWVDELGRDLSGSGVSNDGGTTDRVHGEFLTGLQELPDTVLFMAAANRISGLPPEMLRADRFDKIMFVGFPTAAERADIFKVHLGERAGEFDLEELAGATTTFTGAEIKSLIIETRSKISPVEQRQITTADIVSRAPQQRNRVWLRHRAEMVDMYQRALIEFEWASTAQQGEAAQYISGNIGTQKQVIGRTNSINF